MSKSNADLSSRLILFGVVACFILSGFAALLYQTAWMRQFSLVFGTSELAIAAVLAAYMGGLAFGSSLAARYVHKVTRPVLFYGVLEAGIAISALAVPWLLKLASVLYVAVLGGQPEPVDASGLGQSFFYLIIAFVVLAIPTSFMGATLPLLTKYVVKSKDQIGSRVGLLYATNTVGAIGGTVVAGFLLLPALGLNGTVWVGVVINLLVFLLAAAIAKKVGDHISSDSAEVNLSQSKEGIASGSENLDLASKARLWILPIMLFSGANAFLYEVLWTRLLGHILGGSIAAFATMLAGFLSGIAIGSAVASRLAKTREVSINWFVLVQCGIACTSIVIYQILPLIIPDTTGLAGNVVLAILILLPATIFIGATFPFAVRVLATTSGDAAPASARVYAWNTVGAIIGATVAAFFLIPALKYEGAILFAVVGNATLALGAALFLGNCSRPYQVGAALFVLGIAIFYRPLMPEDILRQSPVYTLPDGDIRYYEVGRSSTVMVIEKDGYFNIRNNGLPEASALVKGSPPSIHNQRLLTVTPVLARPDTETMLVVGLGGAVALEGVPKSVKSIDVIELEEEVVKANLFYGDKRKTDPLKDPRFNIIINDARSAMTLTTKKYDAIVSQPSHPWTAGASHLYTREFMALAKEHLNEDGVYLQWMNTQFVDEFLLKSLTATMLDVYPHVRLYQWNNESLFFLGSDSPLDVEENIARTGRPLRDDWFQYIENGLGSVEDVVAALTMDQGNVETFALGGKVITDNNNYMATRSARVMNTPAALRGQKLQNLLFDYDPLVQPNGSMRNGLFANLNFLYISRKLETLRMKPRAIKLGSALIDDKNPNALALFGVGQGLQGEKSESTKNLLAALEANPANQQARYALLEPWFSELIHEEEVPEYVNEQMRLLSGTAKATYQGLVAATKLELRALAALDAELAQVRPSDYWYEASVKLRAQWRVKVITPEFQPRLANEATALIDSAVVFSQDPVFYSIRIHSTMLAEDFVSAVETARRLMSRVESLEYLQINSTVTPSVDEVNKNLAFVKDVDGLLSYLAERPSSGIPEHELEELKNTVEWTTDWLNDLKN